MVDAGPWCDGQEDRIQNWPLQRPFPLLPLLSVPPEITQAPEVAAAAARPSEVDEEVAARCDRCLHQMSKCRSHAPAVFDRGTERVCDRVMGEPLEKPGSGCRVDECEKVVAKLRSIEREEI